MGQPRIHIGSLKMGVEHCLLFVVLHNACHWHLIRCMLMFEIAIKVAFHLLQGSFFYRYHV